MSPVDLDAIARYVDQGRHALIELLEQEHAAVWAEVQAKIADEVWPTLPNHVEPHHLTTVRRKLIADEIIEEVAAPTRGGRTELVLAFTDRASRPGGERAFEDAAARKRLLAARYHSWGRGSKGHPNVIGSAGERMVRASLLAAAPGRYTPLPVSPSGELTHLFGKPVPGGPLDNAAYLTLTDVLGRPTGVVTVLIEVKNVRHWIYPESAELYDLLDKAARLQVANPGQPFVPVLVCRRAHRTTFLMAAQLGFFVVDAKAQFLLQVQDVRPEHVEQVRRELGFRDLVLIAPSSTQSSSSMRRRFEVVIPSVAARSAERFAQSASIVTKVSATLRKDSLTDVQRRRAFERLHTASEELPDFAGGW